MAGFGSCYGKAKTPGKAYAPKVSRQQLAAQKIARKTVPRSGNESESEPEEVTTQSFSVKFDDQG